jgi:hypothetical protein
MGEQRNRRNVIIAAAAIGAAAVVVVLVIVLSGDDEGTPSTPTQASTTGTTGTAKSGQKSGEKGTRGSTKHPATPGTAEQRTRQLTPKIRQRVASSDVETIRVKSGVPVGGLLRLVYQHGSRVQLRILPDRTERFVIPTLGLAEKGGPPHGATFDFVPKEGGLFGVELRRGGQRTRVAVLVVH